MCDEKFKGICFLPTYYKYSCDVSRGISLARDLCESVLDHKNKLRYGIFVSDVISSAFISSRYYVLCWIKVKQLFIQTKNYSNNVWISLSRAISFCTWFASDYATIHFHFSSFFFSFRIRASDTRFQTRLSMQMRISLSAKKSLNGNNLIWARSFVFIYSFEVCTTFEMFFLHGFLSPNPHSLVVRVWFTKFNYAWKWKRDDCAWNL